MNYSLPLFMLSSLKDIPAAATSHCFSSIQPGRQFTLVAELEAECTPNTYMKIQPIPYSGISINAVSLENGEGYHFEDSEQVIDEIPETDEVSTEKSKKENSELADMLKELIKNGYFVAG